MIQTIAAVAALVIALGAAWVIWRRSVRSGSEAEPQVSGERESRARTFMKSGQHKEMPRATISDLRLDAQTLLEEAEAAADLETLDAYLADVRDSLGADEAVFWRWSEQRDSLAPAAWSTPGAGRPMHFDVGGWAGLVKWAAEARVIHFDSDARVAVARLAAAPIESEGKLMGVLSVARIEGLEKGREYVKEWLPRHASQVGRLVSMSELRREYSRYMRQSRALLSAVQRVQGHKSQEALCKAICATALQVSSASDAAVLRWHAGDSRGWVQYTTPGFRHRGPYELTKESLAARALQEGTSLLIEDVAKMTGDKSLFFAGDGGWPSGTVAVVPLKLEEKVIGAIVVAAERAGVVPQDEARNVTLLGALAAPSLEMVWEMEEVSKRARTDALTGLANRRAFDEQLAQLLNHADRFGHSLSLILADVDHFKVVNDTWGHETGDIVLKAIADTLAAGVRNVDVCARFGGEEIAIILPQTTLVGAVELADRLRAAVGANRIWAGGNEIPVTVSCGVACYPDGALTKEALFAAADKALYDAKGAGRNCVRSAVPKPTGNAS
ncbi:MAG: sensor domain-containing diguanylate cyclase [Gemmatimonadota bacterium]